MVVSDKCGQYMLMLNVVFTILKDGSCLYGLKNVRSQKFCLTNKINTSQRKCIFSFILSALLHLAAHIWLNPSIRANKTLILHSGDVEATVPASSHQVSVFPAAARLADAPLAVTAAVIQCHRQGGDEGDGAARTREATTLRSQKSQH